MGSTDHEREDRASKVSSNKTSIFATVFLVVLVLVGASSLEFYSSTFQVSPSGSRPASFSSSVSPLGLQLSLAIDATAIRRYGSLRVQTEVINTLDRNVSITLGQVNANISAWNRYDFFCGVNIAESLVGFALLKGDYFAANISRAGNPLQLAPLVSTTCPNFPYPQEIVFKPMSRVLAASNGPRAGVALNVTSEECFSLSPTVHECGPSTRLFGYWNTQSFLSLGGATFRSPYFQYLLPGVYTIVATDAWGQAIYAHFDVE
jgi:hypothetical protein